MPPPFHQHQAYPHAQSGPPWNILLPPPPHLPYTTPPPYPSMQTDTDIYEDKHIQHSLPKPVRTSAQHVKENENLVKEGEIVRNYNTPGIVPKFVPRQVSKIKTNSLKDRGLIGKVETEKGTDVKNTIMNDDVNEDLRQRAMVLTEPAGPELPQDDTNKTLTKSSSSFAATVTNIRKQVKQVCILKKTGQIINWGNNGIASIVKIT